MSERAATRSLPKRVIINTLRALGMESLLWRLRPGLRIHRPLARALGWARAQEHPEGGIRIHAGHPMAYPEVTGYFIPSLLAWGEHDFAVRCARWLLSIQNPDGSWSDPFTGKPFTFDTGQVLKGLVAIHRRLPEVEPAIRRGCDWFLTQVRDDGRVLTPDRRVWGQPGRRGAAQEYVHLYALEAVRDAGRLFNEPRYERAVARALEWHLAQRDLAWFSNLSHFHAYVLEALVDLGRPDEALRALAEVEALQRPSGAVPAYWDVRWVCSTGLAQYAVVWFKLGRLDRARKALEYLCRLQNRSGGFYGSYGFRADYFKRREIAWAVKYFLDACYWHLRTAFDHLTETFESALPETDGRVRAVLEGLGDVSGRRILDVGCGRGAYAKHFVERFPSAEVWGLDLSQANLRSLPSPIKPCQGTFLDIPFDDGMFDGAWSVEALEHAINPQTAVAEMCRVVRPGGRIVIIDKNRERSGLLRTETWEQWFARDQVEAWLAPFCADVTSRIISPPPRPDWENLLIVWQGTRK